MYIVNLFSWKSFCTFEIHEENEYSIILLLFYMHGKQFNDNQLFHQLINFCRVLIPV